MQEVWRPINGFDGWYEVSNLGKIKTCAHCVMRKNGKPLAVQERIIKGSKDTKGYLQVELRKDGKRNIKFVHRLVAEAFIENPQGKAQVNHKDGNKLNNCADNLEWVTVRENINHAWETGLQIARKGESHSNHKLTDNDVRFIKENYKPRDKNFGMSALARRFNVTIAPIYQIVHGKGWKHI